MDRIFNIDITAREYLANAHEKLGEVKGVVAAQVWCCLVCGSQGRRVSHWDETPAHTPGSLGMGSCARDSHQMACIEWGISNQAQTCLTVSVWQDSVLYSKVHSEGRGYDSLEEILYILTGMAQAYSVARETLIGLVPTLAFDQHYSD